MKMKYLFLMVFILNAIIIKSQTIDIEKHNLFKMTQKNESGKELMLKWTEVMKETGGYPNMPYNEKLNDFVFEKIIKCEGLSKKDIMARLKQFVSEKFGKYESVVDYIDEDAGKLIVKGYFNAEMSVEFDFFFFSKARDFTSSVKVYSTYVFTIKDNSYKLETKNQEIQSEYGGYLSGSIYVPRSSFRSSLMTNYPLTSKDISSWKGIFNLMHQISKHNERFPNESKDYVLNKDNDYKF